MYSYLVNEITPFNYSRTCTVENQQYATEIPIYDDLNLKKNSSHDFKNIKF